MIGWIALTVTVGVLISIGRMIDDWGRDWSQNYAELRDDAERSDLQPLVLEMSAEKLVAKLIAWSESQPMWTVKSHELFETPANGQVLAQLHLTRRTPVFRFVDDVHVRIVALDSDKKVKLIATSQSRIGKGDLGQNPRNLLELKRCFSDAGNQE